MSNMQKSPWEKIFTEETADVKASVILEIYNSMIVDAVTNVMDHTHNKENAHASDGNEFDLTSNPYTLPKL